MSVGNLAPVLRQFLTDANGDPLAGGKVYAYQAGTTTPQNTYTDSTLGTPNANPVVLDSAGSAPIWLDPALSYKFVVKDSGGVTQYTTDNVAGLAYTNSISTAALQDGCVTTAKLADSAVTAAKLASDASVDANRPVNTNNIRNNAITSGKLASSALYLSVVSKVTTYFATAADDVIMCDASSGGWTLNLPTAVGITGKRLRIVRTDSTPANTLTVDPNSSETVGGSLTKLLMTKDESIEIVSDGSNWLLLSHTCDTQTVGYTPTISWTSTSTPLGTWRRVGDCAEFTGKVPCNGAPSGAGLNISLPSGLSIDTNKLAGENTSIASLGEASFDDTGVTAYISGTVFYSSTTTVNIGVPNVAGTFPVRNAVTPTTPFTFGSGDSVNWKFKVPITNWWS